MKNVPNRSVRCETTIGRPRSGRQARGGADREVDRIATAQST